MSVLLAAVLLQANPADIFDGMRRALEGTTALWYESRGEFKNGNESSTLTTSVRVTATRARLDFAITRGGTTRDVKIVWAATHCQERDGARDLIPEESQADWRNRLTCGLTRAGAPGLSFVSSSARFTRRVPNDLPDFATLECTDFAGGGEEILGERKAWKVSCRATLKDSGLEPFALTVWIDREKSTPLKRTIEAKARDRAVTVTETITRCDLNPTINDADVTLPPR